MYGTRCRSFNPAKAKRNLEHVLAALRWLHDLDHVQQMSTWSEELATPLRDFLNGATVMHVDNLEQRFAVATMHTWEMQANTVLDLEYWLLNNLQLGLPEGPLLRAHTELADWYRHVSAEHRMLLDSSAQRLLRCPPVPPATLPGISLAQLNELSRVQTTDSSNPSTSQQK
ncbi:MAG: hypothetical protein MHM6MM_008559 [Cercozoa sp. M6MM]